MSAESKPVKDPSVSDEAAQGEDDETDPAGADPVDAMTPDERVNNVRSLLPVHAAPKHKDHYLKVARRPGRPRQVERMPTTSDLQYHDAMLAERQDFISKDPVVLATGGKIRHMDLLCKLRHEVAREAASIHFQRIENEKYGKDTAQMSSRRIDALIKIAQIEADIAKLGPDMVDVRSEAFGKVVKLFLEFIQEAAAETLAPEVLNLFFNRLETKMAGWEEKAEAALR